MSAQSKELEGLVAVVTGAGAGIGRAIAGLLASRGARVAAFELQEAAGQDVVRELQASGAEAMAAACDVTKAVEIERAVAAVVARYGQIDVLVNNAGGPAKKALVWDLDEAGWDGMMALNLKSAYLCCRAVLPRMIERKQGSVVNLTSDQAFQPTPGRAAYAAAKAGIVGFARGLAVDVGQHGVRVNVVAPGPTLTERTRQIAGEQAIAQLAARHPLQKLADPDDIAEAVAYLASPRSRHITGHVLHVSGGLILA